MIGFLRVLLSTKILDFSFCFILAMVLWDYTCYFLLILKCLIFSQPPIIGSSQNFNTLWMGVEIELLKNNFTLSGKLKDALSLQFIKSTCKYIYPRVIYGHRYQVICT